MTTLEEYDDQIDALSAELFRLRSKVNNIQRKLDQAKTDRVSASGADEIAEWAEYGPWTEEQYVSRSYSSTLYGDPDRHAKSCDKLIRIKSSGVGCTCGVRWYCL